MRASIGRLGKASWTGSSFGPSLPRQAKPQARRGFALFSKKFTMRNVPKDTAQSKLAAATLRGVSDIPRANVPAVRYISCQEPLAPTGSMRRPLTASGFMSPQGRRRRRWAIHSITLSAMARLMAQKLSEALGQQFYVENQGGASGRRRKRAEKISLGIKPSGCLPRPRITVRGALHRPVPIATY